MEKYRPLTMEELTFHPDVGLMLRQIAASGSLPHMLFYGPPGGGKMTRVRAVLRAVFGVGVSRCRSEVREVQIPGIGKVDVVMARSSFHIEITPASAGRIKDRHIIKLLVKELAETPLPPGSTAAFKVVVLHRADELSPDAQAALRRTMEMYSGTCRMIFVAEHQSKLMPAVRSRCLLVRIPQPPIEDVSRLLVAIGQKEGCLVPAPVALRIAKHWRGNLRGALRGLETLRKQCSPKGGFGPLAAELPEGANVPLLGWEKAAKTLVGQLMESRTVKTATACRQMLNQMLQARIPASSIMSRFYQLFLERPEVNESDEKVYAVTAACGKFDHSLVLGNEPIFHLDAFIMEVCRILDE